MMAHYAYSIIARGRYDCYPLLLLLLPLPLLRLLRLWA